MKKLFIIICMIAIVTSCGAASSIEKPSNLPKDVQVLMEYNKYDTILVIETENGSYFFNKDKTYHGSLNASEENPMVIGLIFVVFLLLFLWVVL